MQCRTLSGGRRIFDRGCHGECLSRAKKILRGTWESEKKIVVCKLREEVQICNFLCLEMEKARKVASKGGQVQSKVLDEFAEKSTLVLSLSSGTSCIKCTRAA